MTKTTETSNPIALRLTNPRVLSSSSIINCLTTILEKDGKEFDLGSCLENKRKNLCLIEPLKDNPELYKKYKRRASYTIHSRSTKRYMYRDYNSQYE